jgi:hypothetical protein
VIEGLVHLHAPGLSSLRYQAAQSALDAEGRKDHRLQCVGAVQRSESRGGGSRRYLPPDFDPEIIAAQRRAGRSRSLRSGLTLYEALTGRYPWDTSEPPLNTPAPPDPRALSGYADLAADLVSIVLKAIAPRRAERFASAIAFRDALAEVRQARRIQLRSA